MKYWETHNGTPIAYKDLDDTHLLNILRWIELRAEDGMVVTEGGGFWDIDDIWFNEYEIRGDEVYRMYDHKGLMKEAKKRKLFK